MPYINWEEVCTKKGAFWKHDRNPKRPFALLTTLAKDGRRRISDGFFNADRLAKSPALLAQIAGHLTRQPPFLDLLDKMGGPAPMLHAPTTQSDHWTSQPDERVRIGRVIGAAYGGITLAHEVAQHIGCEFAFAVKPTRRNDQGEEVTVPGILSLERFAQDFVENEVVLLVEDTITTGDTMQMVRTELQRIHPTAKLLPCRLAICNRSGKTEIDGAKIFSLLAPKYHVWSEGENPFTSNGKEQVGPLKPKGKNWDALTKTSD